MQVTGALPFSLPELGMILRTTRFLSRLASSIVLASALSTPMLAQSRVYDNSSTDTFITYIYSAVGATQFGDVVQLGGTDRTLSDVSVQFYNSGAGGSFSAQLNLYSFGSAVGPSLGTAAVSGITTVGGDVFTVTFSGLNILVPDQIAFAVSVSNFVGNLDVGLNAFEPPTVGSSNNSSLLLNTGSGLVAGAAVPGTGNLYFVANAYTVPEPSTIVLVGSGLLMFAVARRRRSIP